MHGHTAAAPVAQELKSSCRTDSQRLASIRMDSGSTTVYKSFQVITSLHDTGYSDQEWWKLTLISYDQLFSSSVLDANIYGGSVEV